MNDSRPRICVVGSVNMDLVVRAPHLPAAGETLLGGSFARHPGGKGANQAVAAARMGAAASLVGAVGDDDHGRALREAMAGEGVDLGRLAVRDGCATGVGLIVVAEGKGRGHGAGENMIVVASGANATVGPEDVAAARETIAGADVLLLQLEVPLETVIAAARTAREAGVTVILNAAPAMDLPEELLGLVDVLICNEGEAELLTGHLEAEVEVTALEGGGAEPSPGWRPEGEEEGPPAHDILLAKLSAMGIGTAVLTLGPRGATYMHGAEGRDVPAYAVRPIDTVGAGDAFAGAFATRWAEHLMSGRIGGIEVMDAVCWGCAAGGLATTRAGAMSSLPGRAEVGELLRQDGR